VDLKDAKAQLLSEKINFSPTNDLQTTIFISKNNKLFKKKLFLKNSRGL